MSSEGGGMHEHHQGMLPVVDSVDVDKRTVAGTNDQETSAHQPRTEGTICFSNNASARAQAWSML